MHIASRGTAFALEILDLELESVMDETLAISFQAGGEGILDVESKRCNQNIRVSKTG